ncbi:BgTH12-02230 [Blumeria graminis f. sp. triticale]|uniref:BgTH12-02230 n=1 Tax=Blumeria graminis f. sp. triticale TaxID=1689686 RepID=A0A9W4D118_BLUGR|nr:BgTH12-02230 [Blumeria graminis f. sp. triticale]
MSSSNVKLSYCRL